MTSKYKPIIDFINRLKALDQAGFSIEATVFVFIGIDIMSLLALPIGETRQTWKHYKQWVDNYFKAHGDQPYQYNADDMYAARCSILHNYGSEC